MYINKRPVMPSAICSKTIIARKDNIENGHLEQYRSTKGPYDKPIIRTNLFW